MARNSDREIQRLQEQLKWVTTERDAYKASSKAFRRELAVQVTKVRIASHRVDRIREAIYNFNHQYDEEENHLSPLIRENARLSLIKELRDAVVEYTEMANRLAEGLAIGAEIIPFKPRVMPESVPAEAPPKVKRERL